MDGVNPNTVWTWNAIGKRAGAWNLAADSPEFTKGFLLNHLIGETLPGRDGDTALNADPITGQAAWYDLRVRIEKASRRPKPATARPTLPPSATRARWRRRQTSCAMARAFGGDEQQDAAE